MLHSTRLPVTDQVIIGNAEVVKTSQTRTCIHNRKLNFAVLYILGMDKFNLIDQIRLPEHHRTCQTIKITSCPPGS